MNRLILILLLGCVSCGPMPGSAINTVNNANIIDEAFKPLYSQFVADSNTNGVNLNYNQGIIIQFSTLEQQNSVGEIIGECSILGYGGGTISIDAKFWNTTDSLTQKLLLYHELGHCVLSESHTTNPIAIMNALINYPEAYDLTQMPLMITQLFQRVGI